MLELFASPENWIALLTLTVLEIVLGIDNIVFISILSGKLPEHQRGTARQVGLALAMFMRIGLLFSLSWLVSLTAGLFTVFDNEISGRDLILISGGLFLLAKATREVHHNLEGETSEGTVKAVSFASVITQILLLDLVFSLDSVITAVGMVDEVTIMIIAVVFAVGVMLIFAKSVSEFVENHPTVKMLALSFLLLIGMSLVADGLDFHIPKGYIYFAMGFSIMVEFLNLLAKRRRRSPVQLRKRYSEDAGA